MVDYQDAQKESAPKKSQRTPSQTSSLNSQRQQQGANSEGNHNLGYQTQPRRKPLIGVAFAFLGSTTYSQAKVCKPNELQRKSCLGAQGGRGEEASPTMVVPFLAYEVLETQARQMLGGCAGMESGHAA